MSKLLDVIIRNKEWIKKVFPIEFLRKAKKRTFIAMINRYKPAPVGKRLFRTFPVGVNLIGDIQIEIGLGQSTRLLANALNYTKYAFGIYNYNISDTARHNDHSWDHKMVDSTRYGINLFHMNPPELLQCYLNMGETLWHNHYNIGFWLWELEKVPEEQLVALKLVDEIWTPSEFTSNCYRKVTDKPVYTIPYHVTAETSEQFNRAHFQLPEDKFLFLAMFDYNSTMSRKNPMGAINAFKQAFDKGSKDVGLVIKVNNPTEECMATLRDLLDGYENVYFITKILDKPEVNGLINCVDVFVSMHRAEGFGLVMAEAMLLKTACIATNWSSNTEFMTSDVACMLPYTMTEIKTADSVYPAGGIWADPSVEDAAKYMRKLKEDPDFYHQMVQNAYAYANQVLGKEKITEMLEKRIGEIYQQIGEL